MSDEAENRRAALVAAVRQRRLTNPETLRILAGAYDGRGAPSAGAVSVLDGTQLSPAEYDALVSAALGESAQEAAERLHKSPWTIRTQRNHVITKLGASNMAHAVFIAAKRGLI